MEIDAPGDTASVGLTRDELKTPLLRELDGEVVRACETAQSFDRKIRHLQPQIGWRPTRDAPDTTGVHGLVAEMQLLASVLGDFRFADFKVHVRVDSLAVVRRCATMLQKMEEEVRDHDPDPGPPGAYVKYERWDELRYLGLGVAGWASFLRTYRLTISVMVQDTMQYVIQPLTLRAEYVSNNDAFASFFNHIHPLTTRHLICAIEEADAQIDRHMEALRKQVAVELRLAEAEYLNAQVTTHTQDRATLIQSLDEETRSAQACRDVVNRVQTMFRFSYSLRDHHPLSKAIPPQQAIRESEETEFLARFEKDIEKAKS